MIPQMIVTDREVIAHLTAMPQRVHDALVHKVDALRLQLETLIKQKLSGTVLAVKSGALRNSIFSGVEDDPTSVTGFAKQSGDVKYGAIQEFGGKTSPHDIVPVKAQALAFVMGGKQVFAKIVHHPGSVIPEHSYMRSSLADMAPQIEMGLKEAVLEGLGAK